MSIGDSPEQDVECYLCFSIAGMRRCDTDEWRKCKPQFVKAEDYDRLKARCQVYREALEWIVRVNAMDYEYVAKARAALLKPQGQKL